MINKKKTTDIQFMTEVPIDVTVNLEGNQSRSMYDPDEYEEEQKEKNMKKKLNEVRF